MINFQYYIPFQRLRSVTDCGGGQWILLILLLLALGSVHPAQTLSPASQITGTVRDDARRPIADASLSLLRQNRTPFRQARSNREGRFLFEQIPPGKYELEVLHSGFEPRRLTVTLPAPTFSDGAWEILLAIRPIIELVTITAEAGSVRDKDTVTQQVNVIGEAALSRRARTVLAAVAQEEVGISLQRTSPTIGSVLVRGLTEVGVFLDGVRYTTSTQRGGINTFFNLNDPGGLRALEVLRGPNSAQYGSDSLGGTVQLISRQPRFGLTPPELEGEYSLVHSTVDRSIGNNLLLGYGAGQFGILTHVAGRRINPFRPGRGIDSHSAITRFLGLPSTILGSDRLPDTGFTQYGGSLKFSYTPTVNRQLAFHYQRGQQDGGKRYDQLLGGDGNLLADLRNLMLDLGYLRYLHQQVGPFDSLTITASYNRQREERVNQGGNGNPAAPITTDKEVTTSWGGSFSLDKQAFLRQTLLLGGDLYRDRVVAPSFNVDPRTQRVTIVRPRVPNGARHWLAGLFLQDAIELFPDRLRLSGAIRYNFSSYRARAADSPMVDGRPLVPDDALQVADWSGRLGGVWTLTPGLNLALQYSRGFRAPNITTLGSTGLVGVGYQVANRDVLGIGALLGDTADESARSTGVPIAPLTSEISHNYEVSLRWRNRWLETDLTGFVIDYRHAIVRQTLLLPQGAVGLPLGSQIVDRQLASGAVFVPLSSSPVLVQANRGVARLQGIEYTLEWRILPALTFGGQVATVKALDRLTGEIPTLGGGGLPPLTALLRISYQPPASRFRLELAAPLSGRQTRLSTLDLADRRTGAPRSRATIRNFFQQGACVRGLVTPGMTGQCGSPGGLLRTTGETLTELQTRLLGDLEEAPLFPTIPGYVLFHVHLAYRLTDHHSLSLSLENLLDRSHRSPGWGVDGPGRAFTLRYRWNF
jgi:hemoglobin/transferrin/lactoferrin receptor protein